MTEEKTPFEILFDIYTTTKSELSKIDKTKGNQKVEVTKIVFNNAWKTLKKDFVEPFVEKKVLEIVDKRNKTEIIKSDNAKVINE